MTADQLLLPITEWFNATGLFKVDEDNHLAVSVNSGSLDLEDLAKTIAATSDKDPRVIEWDVPARPPWIPIKIETTTICPMCGNPSTGAFAQLGTLLMHECKNRHQWAVRAELAND